MDDSNQLIGFFDIFPLATNAALDVISGTLSEHSLSIDHLVPAAETASATHLHIATILRNPRQQRFSPLVAGEVILLKMKEFLRKYYEPLEQRTYLAFAQSREGEALLRRCGFAMVLLPSQSEQGCPLYILRPNESTGAIDRFERTNEFFSSRSKVKMLDERVENIELQLRGLIATTLGNDVRRLPGNVYQKTKDRITEEGRRNAAFDQRRYGALPATLEFCDLRELESILVNKLLWPCFNSRFGTQEALAVKFGQSAALRNTLRHSRRIDEITYKEGEAGIIWFERVLEKSILTATVDERNQLKIFAENRLQ